jgi:hypothetical protein
MRPFDPNRVLLKAAALGADVEEFINGPVGQAMISMARLEAKEALSKLRVTSPWRRRRIADLQTQIWRAESFEGWLLELRARGRQALMEFDRRTTAAQSLTEEEHENAYAPESTTDDD